MRKGFSCLKMCKLKGSYTDIFRVLYVGTLGMVRSTGHLIWRRSGVLQVDSTTREQGNLLGTIGMVLQGES